MPVNLAHATVHVNAAMRSGGTTNDFTIDFETRDLDRVVKIVLLKATMPRMFTNVYAPLNTLVVVHEGSAETVTIPEAQYNVDTLIATLNTVMAPWNYSWTYTNDRFTATYSGPTTSTLLASSGMAPLIGLMSDITLGPPTSMQAPPQLSGPSEVFIRTKLLSCCLEPARGLGEVGYLGSINYTQVPYGFVGRFDASSPDLGHVVTAPVVLRHLNFQLVDNTGNLVNTPANCYIDLLLQIMYLE